jgi:hypothetical protein
VLQEAAGVDRRLELVAGDEPVRVVGLARALVTRGPGSAEPQPIVLLQEAVDDRALADPSGARDDD